MCHLHPGLFHKRYLAAAPQQLPYELEAQRRLLVSRDLFIAIIKFALLLKDKQKCKE